MFDANWMHMPDCLSFLNAFNWDWFIVCVKLIPSLWHIPSAANSKSSTLPLPPHRPLSTIRDKERDRDRDGYYSDRNELIRERERERDRGYLSDHNARWVTGKNLRETQVNNSFVSFSNSRCASCIGESARAQWFRHSDGWRSGSSTIGSGSGHGMMTQQVPGSGHKRSPWDSLPSLRQDSSLNDSGYKSARADSLEQRCVFMKLWPLEILNQLQMCLKVCPNII